MAGQNMMTSNIATTQSMARITGAEKRNLINELPPEPFVLFFPDEPRLPPFLAGIALFYYTSMAVVIIIGLRLVCS
jgi:hypothetical protein